MSKTNLSSPHLKKPLSVQQVMLQVCLATVPGFLVLTATFGWGYLINMIISITTALVAEAIMLKLRSLPVRVFLSDFSAVLTGLLLALALPPMAPWWLALVGSAFAIIFVKQLYGGLGNNPFNPAMAAYALLLISFPVQMTTSWGVSSLVNDSLPSFSQQLLNNFGGHTYDGITMATPLDSYKTGIELATRAELQQTPLFESSWLNSWLWVSLAYLAGGLYLLFRRIISWHTPVALLASLTFMALIFSWDADSHVPPFMHLFGGATMLGAFFIATDPSSSAVSNRGKLVYGAGVGILTYIIRTWGNYPDAIAFSVLLMNFTAPFIDNYTRPRTYGHARAIKGYKVNKDSQ
ncbi:electron transport complex subunit RsxD [Gynuella sp.]|uniref:electron transport complex subunit RsxD n=1 Tax=Gynuella sp. TaxID=2969146 RepID=UPI003D0E5B33